jgi:hypothetical protein
MLAMKLETVASQESHMHGPLPQVSQSLSLSLPLFSLCMH